MNILITTGVYPPHIGGPSQYSKNLKKAFEEDGHNVYLATYRLERYLPTGIRHLYFFFKILPKILRSDFCVALDTFSVGLPSVLAGKILGKKVIIRTGGDFLWEQYVERTNDLIILREFYQTRHSKFSLKERIIFFLIRLTLKNASSVVFSTDWQREIFETPYGLSSVKNFVIENYYGKKIDNFIPTQKNYLAFTRKLNWKNLEILKLAFNHAKQTDADIILDDKTVLYEESLEKMKNAYAVILVSLGDISPNMILDAIRCNRPFICTKETGLYDRLKDIGIFVNPKDEKEITEKILFLSNRENYMEYKKRIELFNFTHSWKQIADEFLDVYGKI